MRQLISFVKKEFIQFKRDPKMLAMSILAPLLQLIILGYAANLDVENIPTVIWDRDNTQLSREYTAAFTASGYFNVVGYAKSPEEVRKWLDGGDASMAVLIDNDFQKEILEGGMPPAGVVADGSDSVSASAGLSYAASVTDAFVQEQTGRKDKEYGVIPKIRLEYNEELKSRSFLVPGILGLLLLIITMVLTSLAIVKEKEKGTLEQVMVTPVKSRYVILGKLIPFAIIGFLDILLVIAAAIYLFHIELKGSILLLLLLSAVYLLSTLGLGLFISTISETQQQAMLTAVFFIITPMVFLSGFIFPVENMPAAIRVFTPLLPLKHYLVIIRGIFLKGAGIEVLAEEALMLIFSSFGIFFLSVKLFRKRSS